MKRAQPRTLSETIQVSPFHYFGIRHHGPGSAYSLLRALDELEPDAIVIEGPPDAQSVLSLVTHADMQPPVALLVYAPDEPHRAVYYPLAIFSPELQALRYAFTHNIPVRFMDLPQSHQLALEKQLAAELAEKIEQHLAAHSDEPPVAESAPPQDTPPQDPNPAEQPPDTAPPDTPPDPFQLMASAAGYDDIERWWEHLVETRRDSREIFAAINELMTEMRAAPSPNPSRNENEREAFMRETLRTVQRENFKRVAVVCGAWHVPALQNLENEQADRALLEKLPRITVQATWVPWTNNRLSIAGGYGAGIESPGWYEHLWRANTKQLSSTQVTIEWLSRVAQLLRANDLDASSAHIIEATRLAEALAALRGRPLPALDELNEATRTVFTFGDDLPLQLIHTQLVAGTKMGRVPDETPQVPLQRDLEQTQKRLRFPSEALPKTLDLDLRQPSQLERSQLLHRLNLLDLPWGKLERTGGKGATHAKSTFHEVWRVEWKPEFVIALIQAGAWGNTLLTAATAHTRDLAQKSSALSELTALLDRSLLANLPDVLSELMARVRQLAAVSADASNLMDALPPLVNIVRYGNVRQTDASMVTRVLDELIPRLCIALPNAAVSLDDAAANALLPRLINSNQSIALLQNQEQLQQWHATLARVADSAQGHGLVQGRATRLLLDANAFTPEQTLQHARLALSTANEPTFAAAWLEGLLRSSGLMLLHDRNLWHVVDEWVSSLSADAFVATLPLIRRTFSTFTIPERRQMGERVARGSAPVTASGTAEFDVERANKTLPVLARIFGIAS